jgi:hypothetical protein
VVARPHAGHVLSLVSGYCIRLCVYGLVQPMTLAVSWPSVGREGSRHLIRVRGRKQGGQVTLGERLLMAIAVLLLMACGMLWYGVGLLRESVKTQRRLLRMWLTIHRPTDSLTQKERHDQV